MLPSLSPCARQKRRTAGRAWAGIINDATQYKKAGYREQASSPSPRRTNPVTWLAFPAQYRMDAVSCGALRHNLRRRATWRCLHARIEQRTTYTIIAKSQSALCKREHGCACKSSKAKKCQCAGCTRVRLLLRDILQALIVAAYYPTGALVV